MKKATGKIRKTIDGSNKNKIYRVIKISKETAPPEIIGAFYSETIITEHLEIVTFEISARIVAGTNVGIGTSLYAYLKYGNVMYMGRRIAGEIKESANSDRLKDIVT